MVKEMQQPLQQQQWQDLYSAVEWKVVVLSDV